MVSTASANGDFSRDISVSNASRILMAATMGSTQFSGVEPCPPLPVTVMRNPYTDAMVTSPKRTVPTVHR